MKINNETRMTNGFGALKRYSVEALKRHETTMPKPE
jgi:hypothetical protein